MKRILTVAAGLLLAIFPTFAQDNTATQKINKKNLVVKEWKTKVGSKTPYLDNMVTYDELGRKIEEIEYASYGQRKRVVYEYEGTSTKCSRQIEYDDHAVQSQKANPEFADLNVHL